MTQNSSLFGLINRQDPVHIDFSCYYSQPGIQTFSIRLKDRCVCMWTLSVWLPLFVSLKTLLKRHFFVCGWKKENNSNLSCSSVKQEIASEKWNYTLTMKSYADAGRTEAIQPSASIQLNQRLWVELKSEGLDDKMLALVTDSCWATNQPSPNSSVRYNLITKGCGMETVL